MHARNIIHRDIKVENILASDLSHDANVLIGDFGSSIELPSSLHRCKHRVGTIGYMAPEVLLKQPYSFSCDVWSLGAVLYLILFAVMPFSHSDFKEHFILVCDK